VGRGQGGVIAQYGERVVSVSADESQSMSSSERGEVHEKMKAEKLSRYFLLIVLIGMGMNFVTMLKMFLVPVILAIGFVRLFYPFSNGCSR
jgi:hypothetical protein